MRWSRGSTIVFLLAAGALSVATFSVKYQVQALEDELRALNNQIEADRRAIHVLEAEWSHLNDPRRLRSLAEDHLQDHRPVTADSLSSFDELPKRGYRPEPSSTQPKGLTDVQAIPTALTDRKEVRHD